MPTLRTIILWIYCLVPTVLAIPTFEHLVGWDGGMGSLIPGAAYVQAIGKAHVPGSPNGHLNVHIEGTRAIPFCTHLPSTDQLISILTKGFPEISPSPQAIVAQNGFTSDRISYIKSLTRPQFIPSTSKTLLVPQISPFSSLAPRNPKVAVPVAGDGRALYSCMKRERCPTVGCTINAHSKVDSQAFSRS